MRLITLYVLAGFMVCSCFLMVFCRKSANTNPAFYVTLVTWCIFVYELARLRFPWLTLSQPYRYYQYRIEHGIILIYGWEALKYISKQIDDKLSL